MCVGGPAPLFAGGGAPLQKWHAQILRPALYPPSTTRFQSLTKPTNSLPLLFEDGRQFLDKNPIKMVSPPGTSPPSFLADRTSQCLAPGTTANAPQSDVEENNAPPAEEVEVSADAASKGQMSVLDALKGVLKLALMHDGLARGLREASKALDRRQAHMCVLNESCEEDAYKKLIIALCSEHKIPLIKVPDGKQLGEWAGLCTSLVPAHSLFEWCVVSWWELGC